MTKTGSYMEAIVEAKRLREVAEENAKKAVVEAVTPRVRAMIERQLLGENINDDDESVLEGAADDVLSTGQPVTEADDCKDEEDKKVLVDDVSSDEDLMLSKEGLEAMLSLTEGHQSSAAAVAKLKKKVALLKEVRQSARKSKDPKAKALVQRLATRCLKEVGNLHKEGIRTKRRSLVLEAKRITEEIKMRKLKESGASEEMYEIDMSDLDGGGEDPVSSDPGDDLADLGGEEGGEDMDIAAPVEIPGDLAQELLAALEAGGDEEPPPEEDMDLPAEDEGVEEPLDDDEVVEIDEGMLRRELARLRERPAARRTVREAKKGAACDLDASVLDDFGGGTVEREMFVDSDDSDLNVLEIKRLTAALKNESRKNRALRDQNESLRKILPKLKEQLEQSNLFNSKLLYVNKLMTNEGVTARQRAAFITTLDKAQTLREVKLLYKTMSEALLRPSRPMNESSSRKIASSSKATQSGGLNEGADTQLSRWGILAGIKD